MNWMKSVLVTGCVACSLTAGIVTAGEAKAAAPPTTKPSGDAAAGPTVNKNCPVERDKAVDKTIFIIYKGQKIGFCCEDCVKDFKEEPEKFLKTMK